METKTGAGTLTTEVVNVPEGVKVEFAAEELTVSGPKGNVKKKLPPVSTKIEVGKVTFVGDKAAVGTAVALLNSAIKGVTEGFVRHMVVVFSHFPITVEVKEKEIYIKNFLGEKVPRIASIVGDTEVKVEKDKITIAGCDAYAVGQTVANIRAATRIKAKDPRVFQDGIYEVVEEWE